MKLPEPKFAIEYKDDNGHFYGVGGLWFKSVTYYCGLLGDSNKSNALIGWAKKLALTTAIDGIRSRLGQQVEITEGFLQEVYKAGWAKPKQELEKAGDVGTRAHAAIDAYITGGQPDLSDPIVRQVFENYQAWTKEHGLTIISGDVAVVSPEYGFGGRVDAIAHDKKYRLIVLDWKTSNSITEKHNGEDVIRAGYAMQVSAYCLGVSSTYGVPMPKTAWVVRFGKDKPDFGPIRVRGLRHWLKLFLAVRKTDDLLERARA